MAFFDIRELFDSHNMLRPLNEMSATARCVINSITITQTGGMNSKSTTINVRLPSRERTAELLGRHLGMFRENQKIESTDNKNRIYVFPGFKPGMPIPTDE